MAGMGDALKDSLATLDMFLSSPARSEACLNIHQLQGMVAAVLSCPEYVSEVALGFEILGGDTAAGEMWFEEGEIRSAWVTCLNLIGEALEREIFTLTDHYPVNAGGQGPSAEFRGWCDGYLRGYLLTESAWREVYEFLISEGITDVEEEHIAFLNLLATFENWNEASQESEDPERLRNGFPLLFQAADEAVAKYQNLGMLMEENRLQTELEHTPLVREEVKVGRNDPCPCGSGKKYKKCCLHY